MTLLRQEGWTRWPTEVPSNPYYSVILWFCDLAQSLRAKASEFWQACGFAVAFLASLSRWLCLPVRDGLEVSYAPTLSKRALQINGAWIRIVPDPRFVTALWFFTCPCWFVCVAAHRSNLVRTAVLRDLLAQSPTLERFGWLRCEFLRPKLPTLTYLKITNWNTIVHWEETFSLNATKISGDATVEWVGKRVGSLSCAGL